MRHRARRRVGRSPTQVLSRARNTGQRAFRAFQALEAEIERAAIMRLQHEQAKRCRRMFLEHFFKREEIAERLRHLLAVHQQHARMHPRVRKALVPCARCLRAFVFVVRERKVAAAAMNVDGHTQVAMHHGSAFGMPARRPSPQGLFQLGSPGLAAFHKAKSSGSRLISFSSMRAPTMRSSILRQTLHHRSSSLRTEKYTSPFSTA